MLRKKFKKLLDKQKEMMQNRKSLKEDVLQKRKENKKTFQKLLTKQKR